MKASRSVQQLYTQRASTYDRLFVDFLGWGKELQSFFQKSEYLHPHSKILDAGCGTGIITRVLYQLAADHQYQGIQFHAFDLTQSMLAFFAYRLEKGHFRSFCTQRKHLRDRFFDEIKASVFLSFEAAGFEVYLFEGICMKGQVVVVVPTV